MKQNKTICLDPEVIVLGEKNWEKKGYKSFSDYINHLIIQDDRT